MFDTKITTELKGEDLVELVALGIAKAEQLKREAVINPLLAKLKYLTSSQVGDIIGRRSEEIGKWARDGKIKAHPTGRNEKFLLSEVLEIAADRADRKHRL
jgi:hypothetical protein